MTYDEINEFFDNMEPFNPQAARPGVLLFDLENVTKLAGLLGNPQDSVPCIHITGTNGKGSVAAFISAILVSAGYKTGTFSSPYLKRRSEQILINSRELSENEFASVAGDVIEKAVAFPKGSEPSEFEITTVAAFEAFRRNKCDIAVIEVGMGGEYDATNIISSPLLAVFTKISKDHGQVLGDTVEEITKVKSGIIKAGTDAVTMQNPKEVTDILAAKCRACGSALITANPPDNVRCAYKGTDFDYTYKNDKHTFHLNSPGIFQAENAALAITVVGKLLDKGFDITADAVREGLSSVIREARFEVLKMGFPIFIADGSHNPGAVAALAESLDRIFPDKEIIFMAGVLADKDVSDMFDSLIKKAKIFHTVTPVSPRAMSAEELARILESKGAKVKAHVSVGDAVAEIMAEAGPEDVVVAFGSFYYMGELREVVKKY